MKPHELGQKILNKNLTHIFFLTQIDINTFAMRVREWYGYHFPEMVRLVNDNYQYCQLVRLIKMRKVLTDPSEELMEQIEKIVMDTAKQEFSYF